MIKTACFITSCLLLGVTPAALFAAAESSNDAPVVIQRAPVAAQANAEEELSALRTENQRLSKELTHSREVLERLQADAAAVASERARETSTIDQNAREVGVLRAKLAQAEAAANAPKPAADDGLLKKYESAETAARSLATKNEMLSSTLAAANARIAELSAVKPTAQPADNSKAELAAEKARAEEISNRLKTIVAGVDTLTADKAALEAQLQEARKLESGLREKLAAAQATPPPAAAPAPSPDLTAKLSETENKLNTALRSYSTLQAENDLLKTASTDNARLSAELQTLRQEKAAQDTKSPELTAKIADLEGKLSTTLRSFTLLQTENEQLKKSAGEHAQQSEQLETLRKQNAELESRLAAATAAPAAAPASEPAAPAAPSDAEKKLSTVLRSYSLLQAENDRLKTEAAHTAEAAQSTAAKSASESGAQMSALFDELRQTRASMTALAAENSQLKTRLALAGSPPGSTLAAPSRPGSAAALAATAPIAPNSSAAAPASAERKHLVALGDTLGKISRQYYGNSNRWEEILRANSDVVKDANALTVGTTLRIP